MVLTFSTIRLEGGGGQLVFCQDPVPHSKDQPVAGLRIFQRKTNATPDSDIARLLAPFRPGQAAAGVVVGHHISHRS